MSALSQGRSPPNSSVGLEATGIFNRDSLFAAPSYTDRLSLLTKCQSSPQYKPSPMSHHLTSSVNTEILRTCHVRYQNLQFSWPPSQQTRSSPRCAEISNTISQPMFCSEPSKVKALWRFPSAKVKLIRPSLLIPLSASTCPE